MGHALEPARRDPVRFRQAEPAGQRVNGASVRLDDGAGAGALGDEGSHFTKEGEAKAERLPPSSSRDKRLNLSAKPLSVHPHAVLDEREPAEVRSG